MPYTRIAMSQIVGALHAAKGEHLAAAHSAAVDALVALDGGEHSLYLESLRALYALAEPPLPHPDLASVEMMEAMSLSEDDGARWDERRTAQLSQSRQVAAKVEGAAKALLLR